MTPMLPSTYVIAPLAAHERVIRRVPSKAGRSRVMGTAAYHEKDRAFLLGR